MGNIELTDLAIDAAATLGDVVYIKAAFPTVKYENGTPTSNRDGTRYRVMSRAGAINVKVPGPQTLDVDGTQLVPVSFEGLSLYIYFRDGKPVVAGKAKTVKAVDKGS